MSTVERIVGEFIDAWQSGRRPDVTEYIDRAPEPERDEVAAQLAMWLEIAPTPAYDQATRELIDREPVLVAALEAAEAMRAPLAQRLRALRARSGLAIRELAARLVTLFGLADEERAADYLSRIEREELDPGRLSRRLTDALAAILGVDSQQLEPRPAGAAQAFFRADEDADRRIARDIHALSRAALASAPEPMDELDRLFLGGPEG
jgi:transcriptional regulator with XRE-family HTH domain